VPLSDPADLVRAFEEAMDEHKPKLALVSHVVFLTGQVLPVKEIVRAGRKRGIPVIVDGAHSFAHLNFKQSDLDCDYFATSLHKWLSAPIGTGMLFVRRERIESLWPLMAADEARATDIRKFEEIGTHPVGLQLAIADALIFFEAIGAERKLARLCYLRDRWAKRLASEDRIRFNTDMTPGRSGGIANVAIEGIDTGALQAHMWMKHRIYTVGINHEEVQGLRVSPNVYSTLSEVDLFADSMLRVLREGL
ncbi:MAG: isopenicillin-N epimerase, partial [Planctomycetota bacterium]